MKHTLDGICASSERKRVKGEPGTADHIQQHQQQQQQQEQHHASAGQAGVAGGAAAGQYVKAEAMHAPGGSTAVLSNADEHDTIDLTADSCDEDDRHGGAPAAAAAAAAAAG